MMDTLKIMYIDDNPEPALARYLDEYHSDICAFGYSNIIFKPEDGYESLINNPDVTSSNIVFIDSRLFENRTATTGKFTGEEFKVILKKYYPFIEVIVVTQNDISEGYATISKYDSKSGKSSKDYYDEKLPQIIEQAVKNIFEARMIAQVMESNASWEKVMMEKITNSISGQGQFDELSKSDIDEVIGLFKALQEKVDG